MPDKQNESKFMAMLERRGMVRKAASGDGSSEAEPDGDIERASEDPRALFNQPDGEAMKIKPAAQQPVPGMFTPTASVERSRQVEREMPKQPVRAEVEPSRPVAPTEPEPPKRTEIPKPTSFFSGIDFKEDILMSEQAVAKPDRPFAAVSPASPSAIFAQSTQFTPSAPFAFERPPEPPPVENYTERYLNIEELYDALSLKSRRTDTIYLIEEYLRTLPESLPDESRREIVAKIVAASGFDFDLLMGDGILRVKMLKEYAERFAKHTDDYISARNTEVDELEQQIMRLRRLIENRRDLHKKQFFAIEAEAQRLKDILTFISG